MKHDVLNEVTDDSFERMEIICEMLDDNDLKDSLPAFNDTAEEAEYILKLEQCYNESIKCSTPTKQHPIVNDTLEEIDLILRVGNKLKDRGRFGSVDTPECSFEHPNVNYQRGKRYVRSVEESFNVSSGYNSMTQKSDSA